MPVEPVDTWLLVWGGRHAWQDRVTAVLETVTPISDNAHHILSREVDGERWSLLLVHYSDAERDTVVKELRAHWAYGFVNEVVDLQESNKSSGA